MLAESEGLVGGDGTPAGQVHNILRAQRFDLSTGSRVGGFRADFLQPESDGFATRAFVITAQHGWVIQRGALHRYDLDTGKATLQIGNAVSAVAAEGEVVWTGHRDGSVRRWNAGKETACWAAPVGRIAALEVCGERVLAIGESPSAALLESGRVAVRFAPAKEARLQGALALFRSDERLAVYDGGKLLAEVPLDEWIYDARDGRQVPSVVAGGKVYFRLQGNLCSVDLRSGARWSAPPAHAAEVTSVDVRGSEAIVRGHRNSALVREKGEIVARFSSPRVVWLSGQTADLDELAAEKVTNYHVQDSESAAALRAGDRVMVISGEDRKVIFDRELPGAHAPVALSRDGSMLAAASKGDGNRNSRITLFELPGGKPIRALDAGAEAELLEISPDGRFLAVRGRGFGTRVYTLSGEPMGEWPTGPAAFGESQAQRSFALLPGARLAGAFHDRLVFLRELPSGRALWESRAPNETYSHFAQLVPSPTGDAFAVHYAEPALLFVYGVSSPTPKLRAPVRCHRSFAFLPDGTLIRIDGDGLAVHRTGSFELVGRHPGIAGEAVYPSREGTRLGVVQGGRLTTYRRL